MKTFFKLTALFSLALFLGIFTGCSPETANEKPAFLIGIQADTTNVKKTYYKSEKLDLTGLVVTAAYSDGTSRALTEAEYTVTPADESEFATDGELTVTITFNGMNDSFKVNVLSVELESIELDTENVKKTYYETEKLDLTGLVVTAHFTDGSSAVLESGNYSSNPMDNTDFDSDGEKIVEITHGTKSAGFKINIIALVSIEVATENVKKTYYETEKLDLTGLVVTAYFADDTSFTLSDSDYTVTPVDGTVFDENGEKNITVKFKGKSDSFKVNVNKNYLTDISITFPDEYHDKTNLLTYNEATKTFTSASGYKNYVWWLDGTIVSGITVSSYKPENLDYGNHSIMLVVTDLADEVYSATATFTVQK